MKTNLKRVAAILTAAAAFVVEALGGDQAGTLAVSIRTSGADYELQFPDRIAAPDGTPSYPFYELQVSYDLKRWVPVGSRLSAAAADGDGQHRLLTPGDSVQSFYRIVGVVRPQVTQLAQNGEAVFGYADLFARELARIGQVTPDEFAAAFPSEAQYLPALSWDPTTALYWDLFNLDTVAHNAGRAWGDADYRYFDARLNAAELALFKQNGFVVSERLGSHSFADVFYDLWKDDLPVVVTTDAILQAWHRTYDSLLEELEESLLVTLTDKMLAGMSTQLADALAQAGDGVLRDSVLDADFFVTVGRSLLTGWAVPSPLQQDARVAETLADIRSQQLKEVKLFGSCRAVDFSQFKPRGHYEQSAALGRYFQAMMWLGRTDMVMAGGPFDRGCGSQQATERELGAAVTLWQLLDRAGELKSWQQLDRVVQAFVGWTDSATFPQLGQLLAAAGIRSLADVSGPGALTNLQNSIIEGDVGVQNIRSDYFVAPFGIDAIALPRTFTVVGQRFVPDSWGFSQTVYDAIRWAENGVTDEVQRRVPSALDAAFAVLGNNQVVPDLVKRMKDTSARNSPLHAVRFRDGLPYQHNLAAVRAVIDAQRSEVWTSSLYMDWLDCLRALSTPTTDARYPEAMRTRAWAMKTLNTQLASWTQLRHNTVLYVKQSYTGGTVCLYPAGFVEPNVAFWDRLRRAALHGAELLTDVDHYTTRMAQVRHLQQFAATVETLQRMSMKELAQQPFSQAEENFIKDLIQVRASGTNSGATRLYNGWYPELFYRSLANRKVSDEAFHTTSGADMLDAIVADVHTDVPCEDCGDGGSVLHEGIGRANLLMIAVDNGTDRAVYAGPVLSHFEFEVTGSPRRLSDSEWRAIRNYQPPGAGYTAPPSDVPNSRLEGLAPPEWTRGYLVPSP